MSYTPDLFEGDFSYAELPSLKIDFSWWMHEEATVIPKYIPLQATLYVDTFNLIWWMLNFILISNSDITKSVYAHALKMKFLRLTLRRVVSFFVKQDLDLTQQTCYKKVMLRKYKTNLIAIYYPEMVPSHTIIK